MVVRPAGQVHAIGVAPVSVPDQFLNSIDKPLYYLHNIYTVSTQYLHDIYKPAIVPDMVPPPRGCALVDIAAANIGNK